MSTAPSQLPSDKKSDPDSNNTERKENAKSQAGFLVSLFHYALLGAAAALLLGVIELADLNVQLTPNFESPGERAVFCVYFSVNVMGGLFVGLFVGLFAHTALFLKRRGQKLMSRGRAARPIHGFVAGAAVLVISTVLLHQQPQIQGYVIQIVRQLENLEFLTKPLRFFETSTSYFILMGFVAGLSLLWRATRAVCFSSRLVRAAWIVSLVVLIACAYYVDSRVEVQRYALSIHRSIFLLNTALTMSFIATIYSRARTRSLRRLTVSPARKSALLGMAILLILALTFTFARFDRDQNLKTLLFYRTTQANQYFKLVQWALDFDRDGYSSYLGGGDCDDHRGDINPGHLEILGDGVDHNCIGGALTQQDIAEWKGEHESLHQPPDASAKRLNVIYLFVDALRADHLSAYGYSRKTSPNLDKLAARSFLFENAYTPAPNTFEALPKFTQGNYWDAHLQGWPEIMARNGYDALLFPRRISTQRRHVKGMKIVESAKVKTFEDTIDSAISVLGDARADRPFCAYLYSTDPHRPYKPHKDFHYGTSLADLYDGEIAYMDFHMGRLLDALEQRGKLEDTMIVIMADHGESLGERGVYKHSLQLYNEQTRVPMIIHMPGLSPRSIRDYVSTIDLGPTILNAVGLDYPRECAGVSVLPLMRGRPFTHPPVYAEQTSQEVSQFVPPEHQADPEQKKYMIITQDGFKLIYNRNYYSFELFDLNNDAGEVRNLYDRMPERATEMKKRMGRFIDVLTASRPRDADESQYFFGPTGEVREAK